MAILRQELRKQFLSHSNKSKNTRKGVNAVSIMNELKLAEFLKCDRNYFVQPITENGYKFLTKRGMDMIIKSKDKHGNEIDFNPNSRSARYKVNG